jgi:hypothetical protein
LDTCPTSLVNKFESTTSEANFGLALKGVTFFFHFGTIIYLYILTIASAHFVTISECVAKSYLISGANSSYKDGIPSIEA